ncbi:MAG: choice-of-anchor Q domain-containing protein [Deinococcota bacterium]
MALDTCGPKVTMRTSLIYNNDFKDDGVFEVGLDVYISGRCPIVRSRTHSSGRNNNGSAQLELHGVTIWNNNGVEGQYGTGIYLANGASVDVTSSIIAMNQGGDSFMSDVDADDPDGVSFTSTNSFYSVMDKFPLGSGDIGSENFAQPLDPNLVADAQGRPVPSPTSLVVNAGVCDGSSTDIRGEARQTGASCDMGAVELTASELQAVNTSLEITGIGPVIENSTPPDAATVSVIDPYVHIYGQAGTQGLTELRYSLNYRPSESYDLSKLVNDGGVFQLNFFYMGIYEAGALRQVADGLNTIYLEARYADGSTQEIRYDFLVLRECLRDANGTCTGAMDYSAGVTPSFSADVNNFVWWDVTPTSARDITVTAVVEPIIDFFICSQNCPLDVFSYRVNDAVAVKLTREQINASLQDIDNDGTDEYVFEITLSNLPTGRNGVMIGTLYGGVRMHNTVLHFEVQ